MSEEDKPKQPQEPEGEEPPAPEAEEKDTPAPSEPSPESVAPEKSESEEAAPEKPESEEAAPEKPESEEAAPEKPESEEAAPEKPEAKEAAPGKPEKPAKPAAKPAKKKGLAYEDLEDDALLGRLKEKFSEGISSGQSFLDQPTYTVSVDCLYNVMVELKDNPDSDFDYLVDVTALDYLGDEKRFCLVYHLYSYKHGKLIRVKARIGEAEAAPSMSSLWKAAGWMEREVYDLFGIEFSGHDDLKRILLPDDWHGHPLRKDYDIKLQDQAWIKKHLHMRKTPE